MAGTFTIGLPTSDYLTLDAAYADYSGTGFGGDITWIVEANTTWSVSLKFGRLNQNTFTIKCAAGLNHNGNPNAGVAITIGANVEIEFDDSYGKIVIEHLIFTSAAASRQLNLVGLDSFGVGVYNNLILHDCLFNWIVVLTKVNPRNNAWQWIYNNVICDGFLTITQNRFDGDYSNNAFVVENNTIIKTPVFATSVLLNISTAHVDCQSVITLRNNFITRDSGTVCISCGASARYPVALTNATTDGTATSIPWATGSGGNIANISPTLECESYTKTDNNFVWLYRGRLSAIPSVDPDIGSKPLRCKFRSLVDYSFNDGTYCGFSGTIPTLTAYDIKGMEYGKYGWYPIGCHNAEIVY